MSLFLNSSLSIVILRPVKSVLIKFHCVNKSTIPFLCLLHWHMRCTCLRVDFTFLFVNMTKDASWNLRLFHGMRRCKTVCGEGDRKCWSSKTYAWVNDLLIQMRFPSWRRKWLPRSQNTLEKRQKWNLGTSFSTVAKILCPQWRGLVFDPWLGN